MMTANIEVLLAIVFTQIYVSAVTTVYFTKDMYITSKLTSKGFQRIAEKYDSPISFLNHDLYVEIF